MRQFNIPSQIISPIDRTTDWATATVKAILDMSIFGNTSEILHYFEKLQMYYDGHLDSDDYKHIIKPLNIERKEAVGAVIESYNIIRPIIDTLVGEKGKRPINDSVTVLNADAQDYKEKAKLQLATDYVRNKFFQELQKQGIEIDETIEEMPEYQELMQKFNKNYRDIRAIRGQHALTYIKKEQSVDAKFTEGLKNYLIGGVVASVKRIVNDNLDYEIIQPWNVDYDRSPKNRLIEDGEWAVIRHQASFAEIMRLVSNDILKEKGFEQGTAYLKYLENRYDYSYAHTGTQMASERQNFIDLYEVFWKVYNKIGILTYLDEDGVPQQTIVDENYKKRRNIDVDIEWKYEAEVYQAWAIGYPNLEVFGVKPCPVQRQYLSGRSGSKLPVNGRSIAPHMDMPVSIVAAGIPFQVLYNTYMYRLEQAINKAKDTIMLMDVDMLPDNMSIDEFLYWIEKTGIGFIQYNKEGVRFSPQHQFQINIQSQLIKLLIEALNFILDSWERISGVNAQRQGIISPYSGKGVTERAVIQSSNNTEEYFRSFDDFQVADLQSFLDWSKAIWIDGFKGSYITDQNYQEFFEIDGLDHMETEYGIFVTTSAREQENIEQMRQFAPLFIQQGAPASAIGHILKSESFTQVVEGLKDIERQIQEKQQQEQEFAKELEQLRQQTVDKQLAAQAQEKQLDRDNKIELELIKAGAKQPSESSSATVMNDTSYKDRELDIKERQLNETIRSNKANENIDRKKLTVKTNNKTS